MSFILTYGPSTSDIQHRDYVPLNQLREDGVPVHVGVELIGIRHSVGTPTADARYLLERFQFQVRETVPAPVRVALELALRDLETLIAKRSKGVHTQKWCVTVTRSAWSSLDIIVVADGHDKACAQALEEAGNHTFPAGGDADYEAEVAVLQEDESGPWAPESHWDQHPKHTPDDWVYEVSNGDTRQSYVDWVNSHLEADRLEAQEKEEDEQDD